MKSILLGIAAIAICASVCPVAEAQQVAATYGVGSTVSATKTRPADTNAYGASDVIAESASAGTVWTFSGLGGARGATKYQLTGVSLRIDISAVPSGMTSFRLHLYSASPTAINDNAAYDLPSGARASYLGYVTIPAPVDLGSTLWSQDMTIQHKIQVAAASTTVYGILETVGAYTPSASDVFTITLQVTKLND